MNQKQERLRTIISMFFSFLLSLLLSSISLLLLVRFVWLGDVFLFSNLERSNYAPLVYQHLEETISSRAIPFGVSEDLLEQVFTKEQVKKDMEDLLRIRLQSQEGSVDTWFLQQELRQRLETFLDEQNIPIGQAHLESMEEFVHIVESTYAQNMEVPIVDVYLWGKERLIRIFPWALGGLLLATAGSLFLMLGIQKTSGKKLEYLAYCFMGTGLLLAFLPALILLQGTLNRIQIAPEYLYSFVSVGGNRVLSHMVWTGAGWLLVGLIVALLGTRKHEKSTT